MLNTKICMHFFRPAASIAVTGEDAFAFLQGQFTNELRQQSGTEAYGLWLNQKGKVVGDSHVMHRGLNEFVVVSVATPAATIRQRLEQYIVADDVTVTEAEGWRQGLAVWGEGAAALVASSIGVVPSGGQFLEKERVLVFRGCRSQVDNFEFVGPESTLVAWGERLAAAGCRAVDANEAERVRIADGIPGIPHDLGPSDLPNEGGLEHTAISYTKGCYLGQEVMARLKNLGQVRRQLRVVQGTGGVPAPGAALFQEGRKAGEIRTSAAAGDGFIALAMLTRLGFDPKKGFSFGGEGPITVREPDHE
jgi:folate-binding protein YgfZ